MRHVRIEAKLMEKLTMVILRAPPGIGFITSDNPVVWYDRRAYPADQGFIGLGHRSIEVTMPLTPGYCALFDHSENDALADLDQLMVNRINSRTLNHCDNNFIANSADLVVDWLDLRTGEHRA